MRKLTDPPRFEISTLHLLPAIEKRIKIKIRNAFSRREFEISTGRRHDMTKKCLQKNEGVDDEAEGLETRGRRRRVEIGGGDKVAG